MSNQSPPPDPPELAAGWYPDARQSGQERWWDGRAWTEVVRAMDSATDRSVPPPANEPTVIASAAVSSASPPVQHAPTSGGRRSAPKLVAVVLGVALLAGAVGAGVAFALADDDGDVTASGSAASDRTGDDADEGETTTTAAPDDTAAPPSDVPPGSSALPPPPPPTQPPPPSVVIGDGPGGCVDATGSAAWPTTTVGPIVTCPGYPHGAPPLAESEAFGPYVAVLASVPVAETGTRFLDAWRQWSARNVGAKFIDSRRYAGLRDPYLVLVVDTFFSAEEARAFCEPYGAKNCYPRNLHDPDDPETRL